MKPATKAILSAIDLAISCGEKPTQPTIKYLLTSSTIPEETRKRNAWEAFEASKEAIREEYGATSIEVIRNTCRDYIGTKAYEETTQRVLQSLTTLSARGCTQDSNYIQLQHDEVTFAYYNDHEDGQFFLVVNGTFSLLGNDLEDLRETITLNKINRAHPYELKRAYKVAKEKSFKEITLGDFILGTLSGLSRESTTEALIEMRRHTDALEERRRFAHPRHELTEPEIRSLTLDYFRLKELVEMQTSPLHPTDIPNHAMSLHRKAQNPDTQSDEILDTNKRLNVPRRARRRPAQREQPILIDDPKHTEQAQDPFFGDFGDNPELVEIKHGTCTHCRQHIQFIETGPNWIQCVETATDKKENTLHLIIPKCPLCQKRNVRMKTKKPQPK